MKFYIKNTDKEDTILFTAIAKESTDKFSLLNPEPEKVMVRIVLRPGEENKFNLENGYFLGIEKL